MKHFSINNIDIFSPLIGFPCAYLLINIWGIENPSIRLIVSFLLFYIFYYVGIYIVKYIFYDEFNDTFLNYKYHIIFSGNIFLYTTSKVLVTMYLTLIVVQFLRVGIGNTDTFRVIWLDDIPLGQHFLALASVGLIIFLYNYTLDYIRRISSFPRYAIVMLVILIVVSLLGSRSALSIILFIPFSLFLITKRIALSKSMFFAVVGIVVMVGLRLLSILYGSEGTLAYNLNVGLIDIDSPAQTLWNFIYAQFYDIGYRTQMIIENIPEKIDYSLGKSLFFPLYSMLPGIQEHPGIMLNHQLFVGSEADVAYPPTMIALLYFDFGYIGIIVFGSLIGGLYQYLYIRMKKGYNPIFALAYIVMTYNLLISCYGEFIIFDLVKILVLYQLYRLTRLLNLILGHKITIRS